ncbi:roadblock/LC7 domain-containing protein [Streptomyces sp. CRN 30]|uniref:roadblock/LC7 domain-containing protein n=1 Tax=Streptomyces sp. CRN 30 TaxID=3075613 RepID=UPI002A806CDD|nr:roadblock/LC7 domain-containing protein [Streptomyces sp. CRN 30]
MSTDMSWMVRDIVDNVPRARHAVVLSADGLPRGATDGLTERDVRTISAALAGMQSLSRATAPFAGPGESRRWNQTVIEFSQGWVFLIGAGQGAYLAAAAEPDVDLQQISFRMNRLVARLGDSLTSPPRVNAAAAADSAEQAAGQRDSGPSGFVLPELDKVVAEVPGARHAVLLGADGLPLGATSTTSKDLADTISAAMTGIHAYSRATGRFAGGGDTAEWRQTIIEFDHGWIFLISAGSGALLAAAADTDCDIELFTARLSDVVPALGGGPVPGGRTDHA